MVAKSRNVTHRSRGWLSTSIATVNEVATTKMRPARSVTRGHNSATAAAVKAEDEHPPLVDRLGPGHEVGRHQQADRDHADHGPDGGADGELGEPGRQQEADHQVEHHLVGQAPRRADDPALVEELLEHGQVGGDLLDRLGRNLVLDGVGPEPPGHHGGGQGHPVDGEQAEEAADPERDDAALPLDRQRDHQAADQEEHEDAPLPRPEDLERPGGVVVPQQLGPVLDQDSGSADPAEGVDALEAGSGGVSTHGRSVYGPVLS